MTLPIPLTVRVTTARAERHIEADLHDLTFRSVVPGGFASARMTLNRPLRFQPDDIAYYSEINIEDAGRGAGGSGEIYELAAVGPSAHAQDRTFPYVMVHTNVGDWRKAEYST